MANIYPPGPANVPNNFTSLTPGYRWRVGLVLASLLITLALYLGLLLGSFLLCRWLVIAPWPVRMERGYGLVRIAAIVCSALLFLYLLKGLFKRSRQDESLLEEITEEEQPDLFAFIRRICADTGAPFPKHIYVTPEVNAAVFYHSSFLNLFFPTRKNLLIGLGLVNNLNISEFKAVLAHEFGHFSQKSMKLGTYVYVANKVLADIIYGRDFLDDIVHQAKGWDLRIAIFAWVFLGVL
jgi:Zn-dependent protease with chaperone function